jgi:hypothetical protein
MRDKWLLLIWIIEDILLDTVTWLDTAGTPLRTKEQIAWASLSQDYVP